MHQSYVYIRPLYINFCKQTVKDYGYTICVIYTNNRVLLNSSDFAYKRPLDSTKCGNSQEGVTKDMYNILLEYSNNYLKDLKKIQEYNNKIQDEEEMAQKKAIGKWVSLLQQRDKVLPLSSSLSFTPYLK